MERKTEWEEPHYQYEKTRKDSNCILREQKTVRNSPLSGYRASEKEKKKNEAPCTIMKLENMNGGVSVGVGEKKQITMVINTKDNPVLGSESSAKELKSEGAKIIGKSSNKMIANSDNPKESALAYPVSVGKNAKQTVKNLANMMKEEQQEVGMKTLPFLQKEERTEIRELEERRRCSFALRSKEGFLDIRKRIDILQNNLQHKQQQEDLFLKNLEAAFSKASNPKEIEKQKSKKMLPYYPFLLLAELASNSTEEDEEEEEKGKKKTKAKGKKNKETNV